MADSPYRKRKSVFLWEFLFGILEDDECGSVISWTNKEKGIFVLKNPDELAKLWGMVKHRPKMDRYKLVRAMRMYYNRGMLKKVKGTKGVYQFLSLPYKKQRFDTAMGENSSPSFGTSTLDCGEISTEYSGGMLEDNRGETEENHDRMLKNLKTILNNRKLPEGNIVRHEDC